MFENPASKRREIKYLGLTVDKNLNWKCHITYLKKYLLSCLRQFYLLKTVCPISILRAVYFALVDSKLQYGISCWGGVYLSNISSLLITQKKIVRLVMGVNRRERSFPLFEQLRIFPIRYLFVFRVLRIFFLRSGHLMGNIKAYSDRLRSRHFVITPQPYNEFFKRSFCFCAPKFFNLLPMDVCVSPNPQIFLNKLKKWLFTIPDVEAFFL